MRPVALIVLAAAAAASSVVLLPAPATAAPAGGARVCPTEKVLVGEGWGADRGRRAHTGIDLGGTRGTPIFAVEDGVIDRTKRQSNGALQIVMKGASGAKFYYGHMDSVLIRGGQRVEGGQVIGLMGDTGSPGAVHLHFEYWRSGGESDAVDPEPLVTRICGIVDGRPTADRPGPGGPADGTDAPADQPADAPADKPAQKPADKQTADDAVLGDVFSN